MTGPRVDLDWNVHWCPRHLEPYRRDWPRGAATAMLRLFDAAVRDERIVAACPVVGGKARTEALNPVLREFAPLCCFLGDEIVDRIREEALGG